MQFDLEHINKNRETFQMNLKQKITAVMEHMTLISCGCKKLKSNDCHYGELTKYVSW
jgi:uncharacterized membrane protein